MGIRKGRYGDGHPHLSLTSGPHWGGEPPTASPLTGELVAESRLQAGVGLRGNEIPYQMTAPTFTGSLRSRLRPLAGVLLASCLLIGNLSGGATAGPSKYETATGKSQPRYDESVVEEYRVETRWGTIYGVVERPVVPDGVRVPIILTITPYSAGDGSPNLQQVARDTTGNYFIPRGYARAVFDVVGTNGSSGCYDYGGIRERKTGAAVIDYLGKRSWSNGKVGMIGGSYDGTTQWAAAVEAPKHLTTMIPQVAIGRWWDYAFGQGVRFYSGFGTPWLFDYGYGAAPPSHTSVPDPEAAADHVRPCERLEHNERAFLPDPVYDKWWDKRDYLARIDNVEASVMIEGSWMDYNVHPINSIEMWEALPENHPKRLIMATQGHGAANIPDAVNIRHAWFDYWLLGLDTGIMGIAQVDSTVYGNRRFQGEQWPPAGTVIKSLALGGDDARALALSDADVPVWTDNNPQMDEGISLDGSGGDADLVFLGPALEKAIRIAGTPVLDVRVVTDEVNTWLTPVLFIEAPTGARRVITRGLLNARNRFGNRKSVPLEPGEPWHGRVYFQPIDHYVEQGARVGVALMSMNTYEALYWSGIVAQNELIVKNGASKLLLPVASAPAF